MSLLLLDLPPARAQHTVGLQQILIWLREGCSDHSVATSLTQGVKLQHERLRNVSRQDPLGLRTFDLRGRSVLCTDLFLRSSHWCLGRHLVAVPIAQA